MTNNNKKNFKQTKTDYTKKIFKAKELMIEDKHNFVKV